MSPFVQNQGHQFAVRHFDGPPGAQNLISLGPVSFDYEHYPINIRRQHLGIRRSPERRTIDQRVCKRRGERLQPVETPFRIVLPGSFT